MSSVEEVNELMRNTDRLMYEQKKVKKGERAPVFQPVPEAQKKPDEVLEGYRSRIHKIFSQFDKCTYFYICLLYTSRCV